MASSSPHLPVELERHILELAAQDSPSMPLLILVARRVRVWQVGEPMLYKTIKLVGRRQSLAILKALKSKPAAFLASSVRSVLAYTYWTNLPPGELRDFLASCPGITSLTLYEGAMSPPLLPVLAAMRLRRSCAPAVLHRHSPRPSRFRARQRGGYQSKLATQLIRSPCAYPLAFYYNLPNKVTLLDILADCPNLRVLVVRLHFAGSPAYTKDLENVPDSRLVVTGDFMHCYDDWKMRDPANDEVWVRAEKDVERRRRDKNECESREVDKDA
ncbi:hypothetical protein DFH06DRAFT_1345704 [Mycena polygramma]|nr:hypothetical protein DFH06DRAFT_1345704 [Mycena polygramma]